MTLAAVLDLWIIGGCCALIAVAWGLSFVYEWAWDYFDRTATKPDYHRIAFLERELGYEVLDDPVKRYGHLALPTSGDIAFGPGVAISCRTLEEFDALEARVRRYKPAPAGWRPMSPDDRDRMLPPT